jgi:hypothetical protein
MINIACAKDTLLGQDQLENVAAHVVAQDNTQTP